MLKILIALLNFKQNYTKRSLDEIELQKSHQKLPNSYFKSNYLLIPMRIIVERLCYITWLRCTAHKLLIKINERKDQNRH